MTGRLRAVVAERCFCGRDHVVADADRGAAAIREHRGPHAAGEFPELLANGRSITASAGPSCIPSLRKKCVAGDMDGNGIDEVIIDFGSSYGVWVHLNDTSWVQLRSLSPV